MHKCSDCGREFKAKWNRNRHLLKCKAVSRDDDMVCGACGKTCRGDVDLLMHDCSVRTPAAERSVQDGGGADDSTRQVCCSESV